MGQNYSKVKSSEHTKKGFHSARMVKFLMYVIEGLEWKSKKVSGANASMKHRWRKKRKTYFPRFSKAVERAEKVVNKLTTHFLNKGTWVINFINE